MKHGLFTRIVSFLLVMSMILPVLPVAYATEELTEPIVMEQVEQTEATDPTGETEVTEPAEETEPAVEPEATEVTEPAEEPEVTEPAGDPEATEPTEDPEATEPTEDPEATEPAEDPEATEPTEETEPEEDEEEDEEEESELPYGLTGLPEDYVLTEEQLLEKEQLTLHGVPETLAALTPGADYVDGQVIITTESEEFALLAAAAFNGELSSYEYGIGVIALREITVVEAVTAAADMTLPLPAVFPNYITVIKPIVSEPEIPENNAGAALFAAAPTLQSWETWVYENIGVDMADPYIWDASGWGYQWMHDTVDTYEAWGVTTGNARYTPLVAVLDSGVQTNHPDLSGKVSTKNVVSGYSNSTLTHSALGNHGTHVAGIIAGKLGNNSGGAGIAPNTTILSIRIMEPDQDGNLFANDTTIARAIRAAADGGAWIINMSFGSLFYSSTVQSAVTYAYNKGCTLIAAMGNENNNTIQYPAGYSHVIGVGATDAGNNRAHFSCYGSWADISAPGIGIMSSYANSGYGYMDGTSMATPVVSGVAALYMSVYGKVGHDAMEKALKANVTKVNDSGMGKGVVNAAKLFDDKPAAPTYKITDNTTGNTTYNNNYKGQLLLCESNLYLYHPGDNMGALIYTTDGKTPSTKNGQIVNGTEIASGGYIDLSQFAGKTVTVKAAYVSGMGIIGKTLTLKLKVDESTAVTDITIQGTKNLVAGKKFTYKAVVVPAKAEQAVTWSIDKTTGGQGKAKISSSGVLTTVSGSSGTITIRATSKVNPSKSVTLPVTVIATKPVSKVNLNYTKLTLNTNNAATLSVVSVTDSGKNSVDTNQYGYQWTSSNTKVATVSASGSSVTVTAVGKGTATITCTVLDGSNVTTKCSVTVKQPVTSIAITGQKTIAPGATATYKATVNPTNANVKKLTWSLSGAPAGVTISSSGVVKVAKTVATGKTFTVRAYATDGSGKSASYSVTTAAKASSVTLSYYGPSATTYSKGNLATISMYNTIRTDSAINDYGSDIHATLKANVYGNSKAGIEWTSSNPKVAIIDVESNNQVTVYTTGTPGSATITAKALDGSGKKASVKINVTIPASGIEIVTNAGRLTSGNYWDCPVVGYGKSVTNKALLGQTYGKPTSTKVAWDFIVEEVRSDGSVYRTLTSTAKSKKLVTISSTGKLTVSKNLGKEKYSSSNEFLITVIARTTDGSNLEATMEFYAIPATTSLYMSRRGTIVSFDRSQGTYYEDFYCNQHTLYNNKKNCGFTAKTSNPNVAGVDYIAHVSGNRYRIFFTVGKYNSRGSTSITITSADNAKSTKFTFQIR